MPRKRIQAGILYGEMKFGLNLVNLSCAKARAHQAIYEIIEYLLSAITRSTFVESSSR